jgi:hypothetical protein
LINASIAAGDPFLDERLGKLIRQSREARAFVSDPYVVFRRSVAVAEKRIRPDH